MVKVKDSIAANTNNIINGFNHPMVKVKGLSCIVSPETTSGFNHPMVKVKASTAHLLLKKGKVSTTLW